jgi:hypothetical protein
MHDQAQGGQGQDALVAHLSDDDGWDAELFALQYFSNKRRRGVNAKTPVQVTFLLNFFNELRRRVPLCGK